jgi:uncharacterized protein (DUF1786 family)
LGNLRVLEMGDLDLPAIGRALDLFHVPTPSLVAVSVQDHGFSPNESNRISRFNLWKNLLKSGKDLESLLYDAPPGQLTRMRAISRTVPGALVMDTGASAILGALQDPWVASRRREGVTIVNIGNEHVVAALFKDRKVWGIYEHHTSLMDPEKLRKHLDRFRREDLTNQEILDQMGHGCHVISGAKDASPFGHLSITGPNRERFSGLGGHFAAPYGDMMLTGCYGLLEAVKKRNGKAHGAGHEGN